MGNKPFWSAGLAALLLTFSLLSPVWGEGLQLPAPGAKETCPVCGMFVALYPDWTATVLYQDGHAHHFDGAKDLFKYLLNLPKYAPGHQQADIAAIGVTRCVFGQVQQILEQVLGSIEMVGVAVFIEHGRGPVGIEGDEHAADRAGVFSAGRRKQQTLAPD